MGYTHYWRQKRAFTPEEWARIRTEFQRIYEHDHDVIKIMELFNRSAERFEKSRRSYLLY